MVVDIQYIITYAEFSDDRLRVLWLRGSKFAIPYWLDHCPYDTHYRASVWVMNRMMT